MSLALPACNRWLPRIITSFPRHVRVTRSLSISSSHLFPSCRSVDKNAKFICEIIVGKINSPDHLYAATKHTSTGMSVGQSNKTLSSPSRKNIFAFSFNKKRSIFFCYKKRLPMTSKSKWMWRRLSWFTRRVHREEKARRGKTWRSGRSRHVLRALSVRSLPSDRLNKVHYLKIAGRTKDTVKSRRMFAHLFGVFQKE